MHLPLCMLCGACTDSHTCVLLVNDVLIVQFKVNGKDVMDPMDIIGDEKALGECGCVGESSIAALSEDKALIKSLVQVSGVE